MKKAIILFLLIIILFNGSANAIDSTASSSAIVTSPNTVVETIPLDFGRIFADPTRSFVTIEPNGSISTTKTTVVDGDSHAGQFLITGTPLSAISIDFPNRAFIYGPGQRMRINQFTHDAGNNPTLSADGTLMVKLGGRLRIRANQDNGFYSGTYTITVDYL